MPEYVINWSIDIEAETPEEAALKAYAIQQDPTSRATCFSVASRKEPEISTFIDLANLTTKKFKNRREGAAYADLLEKVQDILHDLTKQVDDKLDTLAKSGSGILQERQKELEDGTADYLLPRKIVLALLQDFTFQAQPPTHRNTQEFKAEVKNYYTLM